MPKELGIDPIPVCQEIEALIRDTTDALKRDGAVVALSGGLDSAVAAKLTVRALGRGRVHLLNMPERDSKPLHRKHAKLFAEQLGIQLKTRRISPILRAAGSYKLLPLRFIPNRWLQARLIEFAKPFMLNSRYDNALVERLQPEANSWVAKAIAYVIAKHRIRMTVVYQFAEIHNLMVVGAANRTEWLTGSFSKWGVDHCADIMPLLHLYRSQLEPLAVHLQVPEFIRLKPADPDLLPGIDDKGALLGDFHSVDQILFAIEIRSDLAQLNQKFGERQVNQILQLYQLSKHMRESPYHFTD